MIRIEIATYGLLRRVLNNLRAADQRELRATSVLDDDHIAEELAYRISQTSVMAFVAIEAGRPIAAWGLCPMPWRTVGMAFAFGTDQWPRALLPMTRHVARFMIPFILEHGYRRIQAYSLGDREDVARWLTMFGAKPEATIKCFGRGGEDFVLYRWLADEYRSAHPQKREALPGVPTGHA